MSNFFIKAWNGNYNRRVKFVCQKWVWADSEKLNEDLFINKGTLSTISLKEENKLIIIIKYFTGT